MGPRRAGSRHSHTKRNDNNDPVICCRACDYSSVDNNYFDDGEEGTRVAGKGNDYDDTPSRDNDQCCAHLGVCSYVDN